MLDEFVYTTSCRNSPEYKDAPVLNITEKKQYLGGAANVALNIKKLKAIPYLVGTVGNDDASKTIYELLHKEDITNLYVHTNNRQKTIVKTRIFQDGKPVFRIDNDSSTTLSTIEQEQLINHLIFKNITDAITNHKPHVLILQDYNKGVLNSSNIYKIISLAKQHNLLICVDPKFDNWNLYQEVDLFKPNLSELKMMCDELRVKDDSIENISKKLHKKNNLKNLLVTLGAEGNFIFDGNKSQISSLKSQIQNPDVCGAGDTVIAVASLGLACGFSLEQIAELSNKAGFIVCQKENVQPIHFGEL